MVKEKPQKKSEKPDVENQNPKPKEGVEQPKKKKKGCCLFIALLFFIIFFFSLPMVRFATSRRYLDIDLPELKEQERVTPPPAPVTYPTPQKCIPYPNIPLSAYPLSTENPGLKKNVKYDSYTIYGSTVGDLQTQIKSCGPKSNRDLHAYAVANYRINYTFQYNYLPEGCSVKNPTVGANIRITLPKWQKPEQIQPGTEESWSKMYSKLLAHENHHRDLEIAAANKIYSMLQNLPVQNSCQILSDKARSSYNDIMAGLVKNNDIYDDNPNNHASF